MAPQEVDVLVVGAGPAGLTAGSALRRYEVEAVGDRGVHPGAAAGGHAVRRVADQERAAVRDVGREVGRCDPMDLRLEVEDARRAPDQARNLRLVGPLHQVVADPEDPIVAATRWNEGARYLGVDDGIQAIVRFADEIRCGR